MYHWLKFILLCSVILLLSGCGSSRYYYSSDSLPSNYKNFNVTHIPNAVPKVEPRSRYGNASSYVVRGTRYYVLKSSVGYHKRGIASYYGIKFHNYRTSSGEIYNMYGMTAANKVLPLPTYIKVTNLENHRWVIVKVNDRGPFHDNRILDLSFAAAKKLGYINKGTALVDVVAIDPRHPEQVDKANTNAGDHPKIYLQLGAFSEPNNAEHFRISLKQYTKQQARIVSADSNGHKIYRVQLGPITDVEEADKLTAIFKLHGMGDAFTIIR